MIDREVFARVVEFLINHNAAALCVNLHLAESLNLSLDERRLLAAAAVETTAGRVPVIVNVSTPCTDKSDVEDHGPARRLPENAESTAVGRERDGARVGIGSSRPVAY